MAAWKRPDSTVAAVIGRDDLAVVTAPGPDVLSLDFMSRYARRLDLLAAS